MSAIRSGLIVALVFTLGSLAGNALPAWQGPQRRPGAQSAGPPIVGDPDKGRDLFQANCSGCHGIDAGGGDGPDIQQAPASLGDATVANIIRRGVPDTPMVGFFSIGDAGAADIVAYIRKLGSTTTSETTKGDPQKGEEIYKSNGCPACHMIAGQGGGIGPELTSIGAKRGPSNLRQRLIDPGVNLPKEGNVGDRGKWTLYLLYRATTTDGHVIEGIRMGEDSFSIVLKDVNGNFHALYKPDLRSLEKEPLKSLMPSFKDVLSAAQMDDLVAYLVSLKGATP